MAPAGKRTLMMIMDLVGDCRHWFNKPICIIASGPSLQERDIDVMRDKRINLMGINDAYRIAPDIGILYAADAAWWNVHKGVTHMRGRPRLIGQQGSGGTTRAAAIRWGLKELPIHDGIGLSFNLEKVHRGFCSGFQALNLAVLMGCSPIYLLGYDCRYGVDDVHWFGNHPAPLGNQLPFKHMIRSFEAAEKQLRRRKYPSRVINLSRDTALRCFPSSNVDLIF